MSITITTPDGHSRTETGRVELLEEALKIAAKHSGLGIGDDNQINHQSAIAANYEDTKHGDELG